ncbi:sensor histidine kinase [Jatrophihabitans lederbergiae]|uniref:histidine kinase n=1 Tax=Jatrophihabitans lederbergiae TaxID=3075547 RepID=A0ABU2JBE6_9ACTN|nr:HAMP domain-containing sensor histidine kinase [Jatrophihabitans sp. DSM 44399]MDT0262071.1 HAMP domain-containing sensor histidine kinase [Jatrophihabitans sp. DSM 44399]
MTPTPTSTPTGSSAARWRGRGMLGRWAGVRMRATLAASVVVAIALAVGGVALVVLLRRSLTHGVDDTALLRARDIAGQLRAGSLPATVATTGQDASLVQVVTPEGVVLASSSNIVGEPPLSGPPPSGANPVIRTSHNLAVGSTGEAFRVVALRVPTSTRTYLVYVATSTRSIDQTTSTTSALLIIGLPLLLLLVAGSTWAVAGTALRPVEAIRARTASITSYDLSARVPEPRTQDEIARLAHTMNDMLTRLQRAAEQQRRFSADAAHELRTPLTTLRTRAEVALTHPEQTDWVATTRLVLSQTESMTLLVNDLLLLARADSRQLLAHHSGVDLDDLLLTEAARLREQHTHDITLAALEPVCVQADPAQLARALSNLGDNATRHARARIQLALTHTADHAIITIADDGPGIPPDQAEAIFGRFTRLDDARDHDHGGTGLGLAIARELIKAHSGDLHLTPTGPLPGATFTITLPLTAPPDSGHRRVTAGPT